MRKLAEKSQQQKLVFQQNVVIKWTILPFSSFFFRFFCCFIFHYFPFFGTPHSLLYSLILQYMFIGNFYVHQELFAVKYTFCVFHFMMFLIFMNTVYYITLMSRYWRCHHHHFNSGDGKEHDIDDRTSIWEEWKTGKFKKFLPF